MIASVILKESIHIGGTCCKSKGSPCCKEVIQFTIVQHLYQDQELKDGFVIDGQI